jgi:hypothetical protein
MSDIDYLDVIVDLYEIKDMISKKEDSDLITVLSKLPKEKVEFIKPLTKILARYKVLGRLCEEDREFVEQCHLLLHTKYILEE